MASLSKERGITLAINAIRMTPRLSIRRAAEMYDASEALSATE
jgi:hypothetical protein